MSQTVQKVTALITRQVGDDSPSAKAELLVFHHPTAGVQLPAGTVEPGEEIEAALLREVEEETGLTQVRIVELLDTQAKDLDDDWRLVLQKTHLLVGPFADTLRLGFYVVRGSWVRMVSKVGDFSEVVYEERDLNINPPALLARISGWLPSNVLASRLERHFFHLTLTAPTPEIWEVVSDGGHLFQLHWVPLIPRPQLVTGQNEWLDFVYDRLLASVQMSTPRKTRIT